MSYPQERYNQGTSIPEPNSWNRGPRQATQDNYVAPFESPSGREGGNSAAQKAWAEGISDTGDIGATLALGLAQKKDNERARAEARALSEQQRGDDLQQRGIDRSHALRSQRQNEQGFEDKVRRDKYDIKFQKWMEAFKQEVARDFERHALVDKMRNRVRRTRKVDDFERSMFK